MGVVPEVGGFGEQEQELFPALGVGEVGQEGVGRTGLSEEYISDIHFCVLYFLFPCHV